MALGDSVQSAGDGGPVSGSDGQGGLSEEEQFRWVIGADGWWGPASQSPGELLRRMEGLSPSRAALIPFLYPRLLAPQTVCDLAVGGGFDPAVLTQVLGYSETIYSGEQPWPFGHGPIEALLRRVSDGLISFEQALQEAPAVGQRGDVLVPYCEAIMSWAMERAAEGHHVAALDAARLLLAAAETASPEPDAGPGGWNSWRLAADLFVEAARASLAYAPDDVLYAQAKALHTRISAWSEKKGPAERGRALSLLGRFLLDAYTAHKPAEGYAEAYATWQSRRSRTMDVTQVGGIPREADASPRFVEGDWQSRRRVAASAVQAEAMPAPADALRESVDALRKAIELLEEDNAAVEWKALVQALHCVAVIDPSVSAPEYSDAEIAATARAALEHIDSQAYGNLIAYVELVLAAHEDPAVFSARAAKASHAVAAASQPEESLASMAERSGTRTAIATGLWRFARVLPGDPPRAAAILADTWQLGANYKDKELRLRILRAHLELWVRQLPRELRDASITLTERAAHLSAALPDTDPAITAAALLGLAVDSFTTREEKLGFELVVKAITLDPSIRTRIPRQVLYLTARLKFGHAANLEAAEQRADAIEIYATAAGDFIACDDPDMARKCVRCIEALASVNMSTAVATVSGLGGVGLMFGRHMDSMTNAGIASILRASSARLTSDRVPVNAWMFRDQLAKGLLLSAAITSPAPVRLDARGRELLGRIALLEQEAAAAGKTVETTTSALDDEHLLASFVAPSEAKQGQNLGEAVTNLKRTFDEHFTTKLYSQGGNTVWASAKQLRSLLDKRTLLLSVFLGAAQGGGLAVHVQVVTRDTHEWRVTEFTNIPYPLLHIEHGGSRATQSPLGMVVGHLRRRIQEDPLFDAVDREAADILSGELHGFIGLFAEELSTWRAAGLDHLVIWPQGPLHYLPWHLFNDPVTKRPLADDWVVTILPSVGCLTRTRQPAGTGLVAVGCADSGRAYGLPSVPSMPQQAQSLADAFGAASLAESEATPPAVLGKLEGARYLHLATHGAHPHEAPAFQCVYLTPHEQDGEGRLFAHQIAAADLRGIELVTLSTCESALGRFDLSDNLRGLPAAFLAAGASAIIGALWPVAAAPATMFFTALYARLAAGDDKLVAYKAAQDVTRQKYPEYRDWGAFNYVGDWR